MQIKRRFLPIASSACLFRWSASALHASRDTNFWTIFPRLSITTYGSIAAACAVAVSSDPARITLNRQMRPVRSAADRW